jgi:ABC-type transport system involved in cytochrome bd biosynthesis fused ATPase/permease subunit
VPFAIAFFMAYKPLRELVEARLARGRAEEALEEGSRLQAPGSSRTRRDVTRDETRGELARREWPLDGLAIEGLIANHGSHAPISLRVAPGTITAIVGPTGIGKTSLLRALLGLEKARAGSVFWGDQEITASGVGPSERPFAWVPQDAPILGDTLVANVMLGVDDASSSDHDDAMRLLRELGAAELAASLGDDVLATQRAVSGGERQWIAVARAFATRLPVLLLDEPTSSLDDVAQRKMLQAIKGLRGKRSVILVTHRPEPLEIADQIVRLDREDAEHGAGRHLEMLGAVELSIEDVGAVALEEAQLEASRERIDVVRAE